MSHIHIEFLHAWKVASFLHFPGQNAVEQVYKSVHDRDDVIPTTLSLADDTELRGEDNAT